MANRPAIRKRQKKEIIQAVFEKGETRGEVKYPPCKERGDELMRHHQEFCLYPMHASISDFPHHIPYKSDKRNLGKMLGRDKFEGK
ncbi:hypothetical protein BO71DRAFT_330233 [Aspergillus ellipticus CBS 707.79]|uniref:Uncharacterized protein n=1 Tax=Aspergillus ellipticus CBS 707.79 TaxID=1448320 RepID=A0A319D577_9EURO|nr:hypothetical protein BO71DRAFT_330233 [Aspergillus ellipticus CBS 707.79]